MAAKFEKLGEGTYMLDVRLCLPAPADLHQESAGEDQPARLQIVFDNPSSGESIKQMWTRSGTISWSASLKAAKST